MTFKADTSLHCEVRPAINFGERAKDSQLDILLLHYTGMESAAAAIDWLCCEESGVSCHYVVTETGDILQLVAEEKRAWHAGKSLWQGQADTNSRSIGIEIVNPGHGNGYPDFPQTQIEAVTALSRDIVARHAIMSRNVLAHSDVAPGRKQDPGEKFPWEVLYQHGVGHWVAPDLDDRSPMVLGQNGEEVAALRALLCAYGYGLGIEAEYDALTQACVSAFQMHFRQGLVTGEADIGTRNTLENLLSALNIS